MARLKCFTWNMQRGSTILPPQSSTKASKQAAAARRAMLKDLCNNHDIGFVTEPGNDLIGAVSNPNQTSLLLPNGSGYWNCSYKPDGQKGTHDCKNLLFSKRILKPVEIAYRSGSNSRFRFPAAGILTEGKGKLLLIAFHATSGGGGYKNSADIMNHLANKKGLRHRCHAVVVGGDMNSNHSYFAMPKSHTHQSGNTLDGFMAENYDSEDDTFSVTFSETKLVTALNCKLETKGQNKGFFVDYKNENETDKKPQRVRVSDHAPVESVIEFGKEEFTTEKFFVRSRRKRKIKYRFGPDKSNESDKSKEKESLSSQSGGPTKRRKTK